MPVLLLLLAGAGFWIMRQRGVGGQISQTLFGIPRVHIPDDAVFGFDPNFNVQAFLEQNRSGLATYTMTQVPSIIPTTAATIITNAARQGNVKPQYLLAVLQREQGLVTASNPTQYQLDWACGYGVPDTGARDLRFQGFDKQLNGAASAANMARIGSGSYANAHNMVGTVVHTLTGGDVIPETLVSAMMLIYTPHADSLMLTRDIMNRDFPEIMQA